MYFLRDKDTGYLLRGLGGGKAYYGGKIPIWGASRDFMTAKQFQSPEKAVRFMRYNKIRNVDIVDIFMQKVELEEPVHFDFDRPKQDVV